MGATIIACPNCGKRNRVAPAAEGVPRCGSCHSMLPWLVDASAESFDAELSASVPWWSTSGPLGAGRVSGSRRPWRSWDVPTRDE